MIPKCLEDKEIIVRMPRAYPHEGQELIRCKDCRYNKRGICSWYSTLTFSWAVDDDDYCSSAERKENE